MTERRIAIVGGGAAGFFAALACSETNPVARIAIFEKSSQFLSKVRVSGGGRCNVTHSLFNDREFARRYPRGGSALIGAFKQFQASDTVEWFHRRGVKLKTEPDGRMFPITDSSETIVQCLLEGARRAGVKLVTGAEVRSVERGDNGFRLQLSTGDTDECDRLLMATGGCRTAALGQLAVSLGHSLEAPVPSLFTFHIQIGWLRELSGVSLEDVELSIRELQLSERGPLLLTHWGLSGPAVLRLSAWGARQLCEKNYQVQLQVNWLPGWNEARLAEEIANRRKQHPARMIANSPIPPLPTRLWEKLVLASNIASDARWAGLSKAAQHQLILQLLRTELPVSGKSLNKDEFVTCGGVRLKEVNFKTMESRICPGLFFAGELLDIDGVTGGFNFQAAWTTGWIAGRSMGAE